MKKLSFVLLLGLFPFNFIVSNVAKSVVENQSVSLVHDNRQISLKGKGSDKSTRTPVFYPIEAFLENKVLSLDFLSKLSGVVVIVTNIETNEVVYQDTLTMYPGTFPIDLRAEKTGNYKLELTLGDDDLLGEFVLE